MLAQKMSYSLGLEPVVDLVSFGSGGGGGGGGGGGALRENVVRTFLQELIYE